MLRCDGATCESIYSTNLLLGFVPIGWHFVEIEWRLSTVVDILSIGVLFSREQIRVMEVAFVLGEAVVPRDERVGEVLFARLSLAKGLL